MPLPTVATVEDYHKAPRDEQTYVDSIESICSLHGIPSHRLSKYDNGDMIVFAIGDTYVVKLYFPVNVDRFDAERAVLRHIHGRIGIPTPGVYADGYLDNWPYLVMEQLPGTALSQVWDGMSQEDRCNICRQVGKGLAWLHGLPMDGLPASLCDWKSFIEERFQTAAPRQIWVGLDPHWTAQIPDYLKSARFKLDLDALPVLLHTEIKHDHILVRRDGKHWHVSGLIDVEPSRLGHPEYDLAFAGIYLTKGDPRLFGAFLQGYGLTYADVTPEFQDRLLAFTLLHRYCGLRHNLKSMPMRTSMTRLEDLPPVWWAVDESTMKLA